MIEVTETVQVPDNLPLIRIGARIDEVNTAYGKRKLRGCWSIVLKPRGGTRLLTGSEVLSMLCE